MKMPKFLKTLILRLNGWKKHEGNWVHSFSFYYFTLEQAWTITKLFPWRFITRGVGK